jgi:hypothetical protein
MTKSKFYKDFTTTEIAIGEAIMKSDLVGLPQGHIIRRLYRYAWESFKRNEWSYDGATFVREKYSHSLFEVAAFIHDWRNSMGYVGAYVDNELIDIMICLNYPFKIIITRWFWMRLTFVNVIRHKIKKTYKTNKPTLIYRI